MFFVAFLGKNVPLFPSADVPIIYAPFNTPNADIGTQTWQTLANVAIILSMVVVSTFILVLLFKFECYKVRMHSIFIRLYLQFIIAYSS